MTAVTTLGFDADDTLWHNERIFRLTEDRFGELLADYSDTTRLGERLLAAERRNVRHYGYGVKGFTLSMIETAIEVTGGKVPADVISEILDAGRDMLGHPVDPLPHVAETLTAPQGRLSADRDHQGRPVRSGTQNRRLRSRPLFRRRRNCLGKKVPEPTGRCSPVTAQASKTP